MQFLTTLALFTSLALAQISSEPSGANCDGTFFSSPASPPLLTFPGTTYSQSDIDAAAAAALSYYSQGETVGSGDYPHEYHDYEGFTFLCSPPYLEFPITTSGTYSGGSPGADRVVIGSISDDESSAEYCAVITHSGESDNDFAECSDS